MVEWWGNLCLHTVESGDLYPEVEAGSEETECNTDTNTSHTILTLILGLVRDTTLGFSVLSLVSLYVCLSERLSVCLFFSQFICLSNSVCVPFYLFVLESMCLSV